MLFLRKYIIIKLNMNKFFSVHFYIILLFNKDIKKYLFFVNYILI